MSTETVIEQPTTDSGTLALGASAFEKALADAEARKIVVAPVVDPEKKPEPVVAKPEDKAAKDKVAAEKPAKKTPLDVAPAKTEKKEDAAPVEEEIATLIKSEPPENASPSSKANHAAMRKGLERADAKIKEMARQLEETKGKTSAVPAEVEEKLKKAEEALKERDTLLERVAFERSPKFQQFIKNGEAELTAAKAYIPEGSEVNPAVIDQAARATGAKRAAILNESGLDPVTIGLVGNHLARADAINRDREAAQENWKSTQAEWTQEQTKAAETQATKVKENENRVFQSVGKKVAETLAPFQKTNGENPEWDAEVDARFQEAQEYFDGKRPLEETSRIIYDGLAGRIYKEAFEDLRGKYNDLVAETERITAAKPGAANGQSDTGKVVSSGDPMKDAGSTFEANRSRRGL